ncbi:hypothetical protein GCM10007147_37820 [Nocardiopsis kunsanensis]|uniref:Uncharacterized protein n=1 Tax=Nocardiopsis kunsanensis TaxID=141693 RepID=A0A919CKH0_9ACTN|nr:hypothetical protein GCM10007147_37820 [Nocardiopsis kunsanensis]
MACSAWVALSRSAWGTRVRSAGAAAPFVGDAPPRSVELTPSGALPAPSTPPLAGAFFPGEETGVTGAVCPPTLSAVRAWNPPISGPGGRAPSGEGRKSIRARSPQGLGSWLPAGSSTRSVAE